jgi:hypothetical protein
VAFEDFDQAIQLVVSKRMIVEALGQRLAPAPGTAKGRSKVEDDREDLQLQRRTAWSRKPSSTTLRNFELQLKYV